MSSRNPSRLPQQETETFEDLVNFSNSSDNQAEIYIYGGAGNSQVMQLNNSGTGKALEILQTGVLASGSYALKVYSNSDQSTSHLILFHMDNASSNKRVLWLSNDGTGNGILIDQNGNGIALNIDTETTTQDAINIDAINTSGEVFDLNLSPSSSSSAKMMVLVNNSNCTGIAMHLQNNGDGHGLFIEQKKLLASGSNAFRVDGNIAQTNENLVIFKMDNASSTKSCLYVYNDGTGSAQFIDMNGVTGNALEIDQDSNSASDIYAIKIASDNAGAGLGCGIDMSSFAVDEPLIKSVDDAVTSAGTLTKQIAVDVAGTTYYLYAYTTGS